MPYVVLRGARGVEPFVDDVRQHADSDKHALGFFPESAYLEAALSGKLLVAVCESGSTKTYVGHILFGGTYPHIHIFQVYVVHPHRGRRIGALLVGTVIKEAEEHSYLSVSARVAADLIGANTFWENQGLRILRSKSGGASRARTIHIRVRELDTPTLFGVRPEPDSEIGPFLAGNANFSAAPAYVIDVNVFLDLMKSRSNADAVRRLMAASWTRTVDVFVSEEFVDELRRAAKPGEPDPILEFASALPRLPKVPESVLETIVKKLAPVVCPGKTTRGVLPQRDQSDLIHIATAIHHGANGFITGEKAILKHAADIRRGFGIDVVGTSEFAASIAPGDHPPSDDIRLGMHGDDLAIWELREEDRATAASFLSTSKVPDTLAQAALAPGTAPLSRRRIAVQALGSVEFIGFASWDRSTRLRTRLEAYLFVDEGHPDAEPVAAHLLRELIRDVAPHGPFVIALRTPEGYVHARSAAIEVGFRSPQTRTDSTAWELRKIVIGGAITAESWVRAGLEIQKLIGIQWSDAMPTFQGAETRIAFKGPDERHLTLALVDAERVLGPVLFLLPGRPGVLVPIRRKYAEHLFTGAPQMSLLPRKQAVLSSERVYFRSPDRASAFSVGSPVVFYESLSENGRGCAFACAVVISNRIVWAETLPKAVFLKGVLEPDAIRRLSRDGLISVLRFGNIFDLPRPVPLQRLRELGAIDAANLVAPRRLEPGILASVFLEADAIAL
jgi:predicted nucleic acid-binding protein/GNAT superfamily N-acetyltransferase